MGEIIDDKEEPEIITDFFLPDETQIKRLRRIIRSESGFKFTYKDAEEISHQLLTLYECLARGRPIRPDRQPNE